MKDEELGYFEPRPWHHDTPQRPKVWRGKNVRSVWGPPPTEQYIKVLALSEADRLRLRQSPHAARTVFSPSARRAPRRESLLAARQRLAPAEQAQGHGARRHDRQHLEHAERGFVVGAGAAARWRCPVPDCTITFMVSMLSATARMFGRMPRSANSDSTTCP